MLVTPLQQIGNVINTLLRSRASLDRLHRVLSEEPDIQELEGATELNKHEGSIEIRNLTYSYPNAARPALSQIDITVEEGTTLGIVGKTRSGKTTLMKLLLRVYDPPEHAIYIGGVDIRALTLDSLRSQIAYVPQDGFLFSTTIRDNIAFSNRAVGDDRVEDAAKLAELYDHVAGFSHGFQTKLGERGLTLSGGQRQQPARAR
ncbi:ATP-binding cassette domain-containing protein [Paenibacillus aquistagni]|uniref:ATP-binding cassette domain-containing protein n=1 Tax=Paenibacillus aquistagni TaxID=1852522 RepID=UPI003F6C21B2